jgi:hypothetical protein
MKNPSSGRLTTEQRQAADVIDRLPEFIVIE